MRTSSSSGLCGPVLDRLSPLPLTVRDSFPITPLGYFEIWISKLSMQQLRSMLSVANFAPQLPTSYHKASLSQYPDGDAVGVAAPS
jgi:hypothetical protein